MKRIVVINIVGLTKKLLGVHTPFLSAWALKNNLTVIHPVLPAVTCSAQATFLTGKYPKEHGIVANGWYFKDECEIKFWRQSNKLVQAKKIWDILKENNPAFTCANLFWWYNMYSSVDYSVTPRPQYHADGTKLPDIYTSPSALRATLQNKLGVFPLFDFWGPKTSLRSSQWIADAARITEETHSPTLTLVYLPHLDYNLQRHGNNFSIIQKDLIEIDAVCAGLIKFYESRDVEVMILSEYGITDVQNPVHINRILREHGLISLREEQGLELLDAGASAAFAVSDHQIAHVYVNDKNKISAVRTILEQINGIETILDEKGKNLFHLHHERAGDLICVADRNSWFTYYYWWDDNTAPDFARTVDIHRKPGYDPAELILNPNIALPLFTVGLKLLKKKLGFRYLMDVIPLDASLVKGSHGRIPEDTNDFPILVCNEKFEKPIDATEIFSLLMAKLRK
jgi:predicted AlkP superfamily pyrophosphatase or phosphodiesterase